MRKRTKVLTTLLAIALCFGVAGGAAYAIVPSVKAAEAEQVAQQAAAQEQFEQSFAQAYETSAKLLDLDGRDASGNLVFEPLGSPSLQQDAKSNSASAKAAPIVKTGKQLRQNIQPRSLVIFDNVIPYVDAFGATSAPATTAGLWMGNDSTNDGSWGYFIGHHPGIFNCVMYLQKGDTVKVCDTTGTVRTYTVFSVYDVPDYTTWDQIAGDITSHGESITLQTCVGDDATYRIVQAA